MEFHKYHGAGNDFVMIDNRQLHFPKKNRVETVQKICRRNFGVGSDGLILIQEDQSHDFYMEFYNPDGSQSFCGNGSRCAVMFAKYLGMVKRECTFNSIHGVNKGIIGDDKNVSLKMFDVEKMEIEEDFHYIDTGSPHYNVFVQNTEEIDLIPFAHKVRYNERFADKGTNVNVIEKIDEHTIKVRTYERGVENETLACGTGVTACAISQLIEAQVKKGRVDIIARGGNLSVEIDEITIEGAKGITLIGPAEFVFRGEIDV